MQNLKEYYRPDTVSEAMELLARKAPKTVVMGGGTWLNGEGALGYLRDVEAVVDVAALGLNRIESVGEAGTGLPPTLRLGAAVTHQTLVEHELTGLKSNSPLSVIGQAAEAMSGLNIRNRASIAGAVCTADSASPLVTALLACEAEVILSDRELKARSVALPAFLTYGQRVLADGLLITEIRLPIPTDDVHTHFEKIGRTPKDYPSLCVAAKLNQHNGVAQNLRVALGGVAATPIRLSELEFALTKKPLAEFLEAELNAAIATLNPPNDYLGSSDYRKEMARVLVRRAFIRE
jgi:CO/xanthine dehydrogenase FAD-binding subunit